MRFLHSGQEFFDTNYTNIYIRGIRTIRVRIFSGLSRLGNIGVMAQSILIVDDESIARTLLRLILVHAGYEVIEAENGTDALKKISQKKPDLVLLDVMMPGMDGFDVCLTLREQEACFELPVIMLSARADLDSINRGLAAGATKYLTKPISHVALTQHVTEVLNRH